MTYYLIGLPSALLLWHTDNLPIRPVGVGILLLYHADELVNHPKEKQYYCLTDELVSHSKSIAMATDKLPSLRKSSETAISFIS